MLAFAERYAAGGGRGYWWIKGVVADGQVGQGAWEDLGELVITGDGKVELRGVEPDGSHETDRGRSDAQ